MAWDEEIREVHRKRDLAKLLGGEEGVARQHAKGRLTIRERIDGLLDEGSFRELGMGAGSAYRDEDGNVTEFLPANFVLGFGKVEGRDCIIGGEDFTLKGGSPNAAGLRKSVYAEDLALKYKMPLIRLHEGGGGSVTGAGGGKGAPATVGSPVFEAPRFRSVAKTMNTVPVATAALGPVAGLPASRLVSSHFCVMTQETAQVLVAGPAVVARALGENLTKEQLGSAAVHTRNGVADNVAKDETDAFTQIRQFLSYMPRNAWELVPDKYIGDPSDRVEEELTTIIPRDRRQPYDMRKLIALVVDHDSFFEMGRKYGPGQIIGFARMNGQSVGIFGNDCRYYAGSMTAAGAQKVRKFVETCETFHIPIIALVDEPGFMIGSEAEKAGTIKYGTAAVLAVADSSVPWASVVIKKSYGVAAAAHYGNDAYKLLWPSAEMGALPLEGGVAVAFGREIAAAEDPEAKRKELEDMMAARLSPFPRAESFSAHDVIDPRETRPMLCEWLDRVRPLLPQLLGQTQFPMRP